MQSTVSDRQLFSVLYIKPGSGTERQCFLVQIDGDRLGLGTNLFSDQPTLLEQLGLDAYNQEVLRYSEYYIDNFV